MDHLTKLSLMKWLLESVFFRMKISFERPARIETEDQVRAWFEDWATAILHTTTDKILIERAWIGVVKTHRGKEWPVAGVLCKAIIDAAARNAEPGSADNQAPQRASRPDGKNPRSCSEFVFANVRRVVDEWWLYNSTWFDATCADHGISEGRKTTLRHHVGWIINDAANYHCQCLYWGSKSPPFEISAKGFEPYALRLKHVFNLKSVEKAA